MNYRHIYHAGNFADVAKHVGLLYCLGALQRKDAAFFGLDSHAGRGFYDLQAPEAHKSGAAERGIQRLIETNLGEPALARYFGAIRWPSGIFLLWYPIRSASQRSMVHARFEALRIPKMLLADLAIHPDDAGVGLAGSGLLIVNPPYGADEHLRHAYAAIHKGIAVPGAGYVGVGPPAPSVL